MVRFIIIGMPRTGSTLIQTTLEQHPKILALGELFHWVQGEREGAHAVETPVGKRFFDPDKNEPIAFLDEVVWGPQNSGYGAVGFKLFGEYVEAESTRDLFPQISSAWPDLSVIHIRRRNVLNMLVSRRMALKTGEWVRRSEVPAVTAQETLNIPVEEVEEFFHAQSVMESYLDRWAENMRCLDVEYEELSGNFTNISKGIFEFLGVEPIEVRPAIVKQLSRSPRQVLENWDSIQDHFRQSKYRHFFETQEVEGGIRPHRLPDPDSNPPREENPECIARRLRSAAESAPPCSTSPLRPVEGLMPELVIPPLNYDERLAHPNLFRITFGGLSDGQWREVLLRSVREPEINGVSFPRFPDADLQTRVHGNANEDAIEEAFRFFMFVKGHVGDQYLRPSARFLDFGSGWGRMLRPYLRYFDLSNIYAFEPNRLFLTVARSINPHVNFLGGEYLPNRRIPRHMFDLIIGYSIFSHLSHHSTSVWLREIADLLNSGGCGVFTTWGERFIDQLIADKARLEAGQAIHWYYQFVLEKLGDPKPLREHYQAGKFVWVRSGQDANYGETFLSRRALERIIAENALPLEIVAFDTKSLPQDAFILRRL